MKTAEEEVEILLSRWSGLLVHSDFVYGGFDSIQSRAIRELPALRKRLDAFANQFKDEPWKIEFLTPQDFAHPCNEIADKIISIIGNKDRLALLKIGICTEKYPFLVPLKDAQAMGKVGKVKWPKASSKAVSFTHKNVELDLVGVVLFLTEVWEYKQNAVLQFIAIHGGLPDTDSGPTDGGQLSRAADKIRQQYRALREDWLKLDFPEGSLQSEVREKIKEK
ncbi:hypothetical protein ACEUAT_01925 [Aeromonas veronii]